MLWKFLGPRRSCQSDRITALQSRRQPTMITRTGIWTGSRTASCLLCQWRSFGVSYRRLADKPPAPTPGTSPGTTPAASASSNPLNAAEGPLAHAPRAYGKKLTEFTPTPLARPIGMNHPPSPGENTGIDKRTLKERHADFTNYEKHLKRREYLYASPRTLSPCPQFPPLGGTSGRAVLGVRWLTRLVIPE